ncbi:unnamed protein product [Vitrella brassicaformis CCMP3155]|uniref:Uncharacterized protein n=1 Tax=Vitrella brassicaformis (strain CCMP3155) TaxID=1169540 RepID=A0A0G4G7R1_VITBC|nr:unnamed protein product [Vitrella brassicaformis CCMP3155]|mmetsp:Transcript_29582/g.85617  ORF Transcript_29582/g.85617 Transcript_29582/m.85617 type:complete len:340 (+) Transcript_29582:58-1077(+)|eukprot:CEM24693.1 unnamed protein product [Vitrella brassicaformis CCMP3155]
MSISLPSLVFSPPSLSADHDDVRSETSVTGPDFQYFQYGCPGSSEAPLVSLGGLSLGNDDQSILGGVGALPWQPLLPLDMGGVTGVPGNLERESSLWRAPDQLQPFGNASLMELTNLSTPAQALTTPLPSAIWETPRETLITATPCLHDTSGQTRSNKRKLPDSPVFIPPWGHQSKVVVQRRPLTVPDTQTDMQDSGVGESVEGGKRSQRGRRGLLSYEAKHLASGHVYMFTTIRKCAGFVGTKEQTVRRALRDSSYDEFLGFDVRKLSAPLQAFVSPPPVDVQPRSKCKKKKPPLRFRMTWCGGEKCGGRVDCVGPSTSSCWAARQTGGRTLYAYARP